MKILIVEDEHKIADSLQRGLEQERYTVDVAYDGAVGYDMAASAPYDTIILDLMLPSMDGQEICKTLRTEGIQTPILMLTAKGELDDKIEGFRIGTDDYLVKPFAFAELIARVRALTKRRKDTIAQVIAHGDIQVDTTNFLVTRAGKSIALSKKEFDLFVFLLRNAGATVSKNQIISSVWEYDTDILPNTIEVYIGYLRSKIDKPFPMSPPIIQTVRGFGYRLHSTI